VGVSQTAALNRGRHLCSAGRPSRWALAHILVKSSLTSAALRCASCCRVKMSILNVFFACLGVLSGMQRTAVNLFAPMSNHHLPQQRQQQQLRQRMMSAEIALMNAASTSLMFISLARRRRYHRRCRRHRNYGRPLAAPPPSDHYVLRTTVVLSFSRRFCQRSTLLLCKKYR